MRSELQAELQGKRLTFHFLSYAYCKKDPKHLDSVTVMPWTEVEDPLAEILEDHLLELLVKEKDDDCYVGRYLGQTVSIDKVCPEDYPSEYRSVSVVSILDRLLKGESALPVKQTEGRVLSVIQHEEAMRMIAWKYLSQDRSQTAVVCLIDFSATLPTGTRQFAFLTQVDLDERRVEAVINNQGRLTTQVLTNVFKERSLSKGALYPNLRDVRTSVYDALEMYVQSEQKVEYWPRTLECTRAKKAIADERAGVLAVIKQVSNPVIPELFQSLAETVAAHPSVGHAEIATAYQRAGQAVDQSTVRQAWEGQFGSTQYLVSGQQAVGPSIKAYQVSAGDVVLSGVKAGTLSRIRQLNHNGQRYLVIPIAEPARVRSAFGKPREEEQLDLQEVTLEHFLQELINRT